MAIKIEPPSPPFIPARYYGGAQVPRSIVIHGTVSPCVEGGARAVARFFANNTRKTSAHYVVDPGEVIQCVGDHRVAYHCGVNQDRIGVELCDPQSGPSGRWGDRSHSRMLDRAAELVAQLCLAYGIPIHRLTVEQVRSGAHGICGHVDITHAYPGATTHSDPGEAFPWQGFISAVKAAAERMAAQPEPTPERGIRHVSANIQSVPLMPMADVAEDYGTVGMHAAVTGWQEIARSYRRRLRAVDGWATYWPGLPLSMARAVPISWRARRFKRVAAGYVRTHLGEAKVTPSRFVAWVVLKDGRTGQTFWRVNTHYISKAWTGHPERQERWLLHDRKLAGVVQMLLEKHGPDGVVGGDFNRDIGSPRLTRMDPSAHYHHGIDHLYVFGDAVAIGGDHFHLHSDHDAILLRVAFTKET